ncbi:DUF4861 family protein [Gaetbulibacter sp. M240]|uniref:DUF4861 family protein n=1 Tax=Gaetbulibacter sp. M240 TaxID=3126511 RepID=UPI00374FDA76
MKFKIINLMKLPQNLFISFLILFFCISCKEKPSKLIVKVKNNLNIDRQFETVEISKSLVKLENLNYYGIKVINTSELLRSQLVDYDNDGSKDAILFQPQVKANSETIFQLVKVDSSQLVSSEKICYSRFVPERTDDYAWENNRVAFRTFGPNAQYRYENGLKEGTLTSGVDAWLKRVDYSIIDNWYKKYTEKTGTYHEDTGEGLDNFHVGRSRGVGGIAYKKDSIYYASKNFKSYKTITSGPIRTSFILDYGIWNADGTKIKESKKVSLDYGSNLSKFEISLEGVDTISAGLTLHEKNGNVTFNKEENWLTYWKPQEDSELGTAIISTPKYYIDLEKFETDSVDLSNAFMHLKVIDGKVTYYAGFGWKKSGQFKNQKEWEMYLTDFRKKISAPLEVSVN